MKDSLLKLPWKSRLFTYGITICILSIIGLLEHSLNSPPALFKVEGTIEKIEYYSAKGSGVDMFLRTNSVVKRYNANRCRSSLKEMNTGDSIYLYIASPFIVSRVDGAIHVIKYNNKTICNFAEKSNAKNNNNSFYWLYACALFISALVSYVGYIKNNRHQ